MARNPHRGRFDLAAYDRNGRRTLLVEVKRRPVVDEGWATEYRCNLMKSGLLGGSELFLLIVPDRLFLWTPSAPPDAPPTELDARHLLAPYFQRVGVSPEQIQPMAFEMLCMLWLQELANAEPASVPAELVLSGLFEAVQGADIEHEPEA